MVCPTLVRWEGTAMDPDRDTTLPLDFEKAMPADPPEGIDTAAAGVTCGSCQGLVTNEYYDVNGVPFCGPCRAAATTLTETPRSMGVLARAALMGVIAALLGSVLYYAVIAITEFEIGLVAIAIGYMVGYAIRVGTGGRGGRRFQVLAVVLTYWAVGLAYTPLVFKAIGEQNATEQGTAALLRNGSAAPLNGSVAPAPTATAPETAALADAESAVQADAAASDTSFLVGLAALMGLTLALPVLTAIGSLPSGLISAAIIAFGMHQAWRMTGVPPLAISGPYRIGTAGPTPA